MTTFAAHAPPKPVLDGPRSRAEFVTIRALLIAAVPLAWDWGLSRFAPRRPHQRRHGVLRGQIGISARSSGSSRNSVGPARLQLISTKAGKE